MTAYYNENDPFAAAWLRELIKMGHIATGVVDERDIRDITPAELAGYTQCHFFAGIGVWSYALRRAGWPDDIPVWTGSCPCQPFSEAGSGSGVTDERHLWPHWFHLIQHGKPDGVPVFGEQVASKGGLGWLDLVQTDLEGAGYACWPVDLCAAGVGAPHIRQRLFFVAERVGDACGEGLPEQQRLGGNLCEAVSADQGKTFERTGAPVSWMAQSNQQQRNRSGGTGTTGRVESTDRGTVSRMANTDGRESRETGPIQPGGQYGQQSKNNGAVRGEIQRTRADARSELERSGPTNGFWRDADWLFCRDGKWRPVEPGTFPLVNGAAARVGRLRGYGNAINAEVATAFIEAYMTMYIDAPVSNR